MQQIDWYPFLSSDPKVLFGDELALCRLTLFCSFEQASLNVAMELVSELPLSFGAVNLYLL